MQALLRSAIIASLSLSLSLPVQAAGNGAGSGQQAQTQQNTEINTDASLNQSEIDYLLLMREEEKVARDVYLALYEQWSLRPFSNIAGSEQGHMDQVKAVMDAYGLADIALSERGQFNNPDLQALYDDLIQKGAVSANVALLVGALVEEVDIKDLKDAIAGTNNPSLIAMYSNLLTASENHLRAFVKNAGQSLGSYSAQVLSQADVDTILNGGNIDTGHTEPTDSSANTAMLLDLDNNSQASSNASFTPMFANHLDNVSEFNANDSLNLTVRWNIDPAHQQQQADIVVVALYQAQAGSPLLSFAKTNNGWRMWNGNLQQIPVLNQVSLGQNLSVAALSNLSLGGLTGQFMLYTGYRLGNQLITQAQPTQFRVVE